jgi:hypothetical protein
MKEYRVRWAATPTAHNTPRISYVEADDAEAAKLIVKDHVERTQGIQISIFEAIEPKPVPNGRVLTNVR